MCIRDSAKTDRFQFYQPADTYRMTGASYKSQEAGTNYQGGLMAFYYLPAELKKEDTLSITLLEQDGDCLLYTSYFSSQNYHY